MSWFSNLKSRYQKLIEDFGTVAIVTYFTIFFGTWFCFYAAIRLGFDVEGAAAGTGKIVSAYVATKLTQPLRIGATLLLTPPIAVAFRRLRPRQGDGGPESPGEGRSTQEVVAD